MPSDAPSDPLAQALERGRRSLSRAPMSSARLRARLTKAGVDDETADEAVRLLTESAWLDDLAYAKALAAEWQAKGHAPARIRVDLQRREVSDEVIEQVVGDGYDDVNEAAAFEIALSRARRMEHHDREAAFRRIVGYLVRRGHPDATARKAARHAVFSAWEDRVVAER